MQRANCIEQSPSRETNSRSTTQVIQDMLRNPNVHYRAHKKLPPLIN
jgi:hypothetical protein